MVCFGPDTVPDSMELGREAAAFVSQKFVNPIKLEFEKVLTLLRFYKSMSFDQKQRFFNFIFRFTFLIC